MTELTSFSLETLLSNQRDRLRAWCVPDGMPLADLKVAYVCLFHHEED